VTPGCRDGVVHAILGRAECHYPRAYIVQDKRTACVHVFVSKLCGGSVCNVERKNLTMRESMRRFTRLTNPFSKKLENHTATEALYFMYCNLARVHSTLCVTPTIEAGIADHIWSIEELVGLLT
jgi:hypothetical protein